MDHLFDNKITIAAVTGVALLVHTVYRDYDAWCRLGPGGLPRTPSGWLKQLALKAMCSSDINSLGFYDDYMTGIEAHNFLESNIQPRKQSRPSVGHWSAPQRQLNGRAPPEIILEMGGILQRLVSANSELLEYGPSKMDGTGAALFTPQARTPPSNQTLSLSPTELFHLHEIDGSIHCCLSAADAKLLTQNGWGERHGLNGKAGFPKGYFFVFAPQNAEDLKVVETIARAAARYGLQGAEIN